MSSNGTNLQINSTNTPIKPQNHSVSIEAAKNIQKYLKLQSCSGFSTQQVMQIHEEE